MDTSNYEQHSPNSEKLTSIYPGGFYTMSPEGHPSEDRYYFNPKIGAFGVIDGMGGCKGGAEAAEIIRGEIENEFNNLGVDSTKEVVIRAFENIWRNSSNIINIEVASNPTLKEMGAVAFLGKIINTQSGKELVYAYTGDCALLEVKSNGDIYKVTRDQGILEFYVDYNLLSREEADHIEKMLEEAETEEDIRNIPFSKDRKKSYWDLRNLVYKNIGRIYTAPTIGTHKITTMTYSNSERTAFFLAATDGKENLSQRKLEELIKNIWFGGEWIDMEFLALIPFTLVREAFNKSMDPSNLRKKLDDITMVAMGTEFVRGR